MGNTHRIFCVINKDMISNWPRTVTRTSQITDKQTIPALKRPVCATARYVQPQNRTGLRFAQNS